MIPNRAELFGEGERTPLANLAWFVYPQNPQHYISWSPKKCTAAEIGNGMPPCHYSIVPQISTATNCHSVKVEILDRRLANGPVKPCWRSGSINAPHTIKGCCGMRMQRSHIRRRERLGSSRRKAKSAARMISSGQTFGTWAAARSDW
eukprot:scaffold138_cov30-Tisochrysis_lutea.AAC.1